MTNSNIIIVEVFDSAGVPRVRKLFRPKVNFGTKQNSIFFCFWRHPTPGDIRGQYLLIKYVFLCCFSLPPGSEVDLFDIRPPDGGPDMNQATPQKHMKQRKSDVHFKLEYKISGW